MTTPPYPPQHAPPPPQRPRKRRVWPWVLLGVFILAVGGCVALVGTAANEVDKAIESSTVPAAPVAPPAGNPAPAQAAPPPLTAKPQGKGKTVVYEIVSDDDLMSVTYYDEQSDIKQETSSSAPWTRTVVNSSTVAIAGLGAQTNGTSVTCRVTVDGKVKDEQTSTGKYAVVNCTAPLF
ncbi:MmpS family transport accessory protein [Nocardia wallacei]|uniref:MmpS family transport accessory protein n=1 Tax=Nocardia wallacei TaxID=480035 RepID=UPI002453AFCC|nr:MmpS family transport accessory protein [Nocardia wallacei]